MASVAEMKLRGVELSRAVVVRDRLLAVRHLMAGRIPLAWERDRDGRCKWCAGRLGLPPESDDSCSCGDNPISAYNLYLAIQEVGRQGCKPY